ncbi:hypothetical protein QVD99_001946 [Batrachochytrium dendrobatidis]|nr:hypothetical protein O5D80_000590 [Batrachochytrium dendrobatidis]KAK5672140.1 hypothetical protein QVD99_001946 [Batrachochytrium dendrobatidis]
MGKQDTGRMHFGKVIHTYRDDLLRRLSQNSIMNGSKAALSIANVPWSWIACKLLDLLFQYPGGLTQVIMQSELEKQWSAESARCGLSHTKQYISISLLRDSKPANEFMAFECTLAEWSMDNETALFKFFVPDSTMLMLMYLHHRYYFFMDPIYSCFLKERVFRITNTRSIVKRTSLTKKDHLHPHCLLPTEYMVPILSAENEMDAQFLKQQFPDLFEDTTLDDIQSGVEYSFFGKIVSIDAPEPTTIAGRQTKQVITISDAMHYRGRLILWDNQTVLTSLMRKNDSIAIRMPYLSFEAVAETGVLQMEYGSATCIFLIPADVTKEVEAMTSLATQAHSNSAIWADMPRDENGMTDLEWYPEPLDFSNLPAEAYNITLLGTIVFILDNDTEIASSRAQTRHGVRIKNKTGICDVTLWSECATAASKLEVGHVVLFERLATYRNETGHLFVIGSPEHNSQIRNVSKCFGILSSPAISSQSSIQQISQATHGLFYCFAVISGWPCSQSFESTSLVHTSCRKPVMELDDMPFCSRCSNYVDSTEYAFNMTIRLDDGTGSLTCLLLDATATKVLQSRTTVLHFAALSPDMRTDILSDIVGTHVLCAITVYTQANQVYFRVDEIDIKPNIMWQIKHLSNQIQHLPSP